MGWASAGEIFDPVAQAMIDLGATAEMTTKVLSTLIAQLQEGDWDTEDESLGEFQDHPAIVEAFRQNGIVLPCDEQDCELGRGHGGDFHEDYMGDTWPVRVDEYSAVN